MSNIWSYDLYFHHPTKISKTDVESVASILNRYGFTFIEPHTKMIRGFRMDAEFNDLSEDFATLDGLVGWWNFDFAIAKAWKGTTDIGLLFSTHELVRIKEHSGSTFQSACSMHISVDACNFHDGDPDRDQLADDILNIFTDLCDYFHAIYGYSYDENYTEMIIKKPHYLTSYDFSKDPEYIFWVNYFPKEYIEKFQPSLLEVPGAVIQNSLHGVVVRFASKPWDLSINVLLMINEYARNWFLGKERVKKIFRIWVKGALKTTPIMAILFSGLVIITDIVNYFLGDPIQQGSFSIDTYRATGYFCAGALMGFITSILALVPKLITDYMQKKAAKSIDHAATDN